MQDISILENLLLKPQEEAFKHLVKGSDEYYYFFFLKLFHEKGANLSKEEKEQLREFISRDTELSEKIKKRKIFAQLDLYSNDVTKRNKLLGLLREYVFKIEYNNDVEPQPFYFSDVSREEEQEQELEQEKIIEREDIIETEDVNQKQEDQQSDEKDNQREIDNRKLSDSEQEVVQQEQEIQQDDQLQIGGSSQHAESDDQDKSENLVVEQKEEEEQQDYEKYYPSQFDQSIISLNKFIENFYIYSQANLSWLQPQYYHLLDIDRILKLNNEKTIETYLENAQKIDENPEVLQLFKYLLSQKQESRKLNQFLPKLSQAQLTELSEFKPKLLDDRQFVNIFLQIKFERQKNQIKDDKQALYNLKEAQTEFLFKLSPKFQDMKISELNSLIEFGANNKISIKQEWIIEWLKNYQPIFNPLVDDSQFYQNNNKIVYLVGNNFQFKILKKYLETYLNDNENLSFLSQYISIKILEQMEAEIKLYQGKQLEHISKILPQDRLERMNNEKILAILDPQQKSFTHGDQVSLQCKLKNIQQLKIKIFQINCENYCLLNEKNANINISLEGIIPNEEIEFTYQQPPIEIFYKEFTFETITNSRYGAFVIEFLGSGLYAKAFIVKGRLSLENTITSAGHSLKIFNENKELCKGEGTGVWLEKKFYQVNERNEIMIPFSVNPKDINCIIVHENYAEVSSIRIEVEKYELNCLFFLDQEQFISETEASITIFPELTVANKKIDIGLLKNTKIRVQSTSKSNVMSYNQTEEAKFKNEQPYSFQMRNLSNLTKTNIVVFGQIMSMTENKLLDLQFDFNISYSYESRLCKQYVKYSEENGYEIAVIGRNGEIYENLLFEFSFYTMYSTQVTPTKLKTNEKGKILLGQLEGVIKFVSRCLSSSSQQTPPDLYYTIQKTEQQQNSISIQHLKTTYNELLQNIEFKVEQTEEKYLVMVIASQFIHPSNQHIEFAQDLQRKLFTSNEKNDSSFLIQNEFQSNQNVQFEIAYVQNRRTKPAYIGNTLEKPSVLLNRQFVQETNNAEEQEQDEDDNKECELDEDDELCSERDESERGSMVECKEEAYRGGRLKKKKKKMSRRREKAGNQCTKGKKQIDVTNHLNFLKSSAQILSVKQHQSNQYELTFPDQIQQIQIIVINQKSIQNKVIGLKSKDPYKKDITHKSKLEIGKFYSPYRESLIISKGQEYLLTDCASTQFKIIDSYEEACSIMKNISQNSDTSLIEIYSTWNGKNLEEKLKLYNNSQSDEFNLFLHFKDPAFFEIYILGYIRNKIEKSFIDQFLLKNVSYLSQRVSSGRFTQLNALEQTLLFIFFNEIQGNKVYSNRIKNCLQSVIKNYEINLAERKQLFDTILGGEGEEKGLEQESEEECYEGGAGGGGGDLNYCCADDNYYNCEQECNEEMQCRMSRHSRGSFQQDEYDEQQLYDAYTVQREMSIQPFKNIKQTCEYGELHYRDGKTLQNPNLTIYNDFYHDLVEHSISQGVLENPFVSSKFIYNNLENTHNLIITAALLGLPYKNLAQVEQVYVETDLFIKAQTPCILLKKQLKELPKQINKQILVIQKFYDENNRYIKKDGENIELQPLEFEIKKIYQCEIVITNCSSKKLNVFLLQEIPNGSLPYDQNNYSSINTVSLKPYQSRTYHYSFYFPNIGSFSVYPAVVSTEKAVIAVAEEYQFIVVGSSQILNKENLMDIIQKGSKDDILEYLRNNSQVDLSQIKKYFKDRTFYFKCTEILREKLELREEILQYGFIHNDLEGIKDYLALENIQETLKNQFVYLKSNFIEISSVRFYEYYPLLAKRVHKLATIEQGILNVQLKQKYKEFLNYLVIKQDLSIADKIIFCYYLLLQSRINDAIQIYQSINTQFNEDDPVLQYDYLSAYLDFYIGYPNFDRARSICEKYLSYPVIEWRNLFYEVMNLLAEFDGDEDKISERQTDENKQKNQDQANKEEQLEFVVENDQIKITYANIHSISIEHYLIDLEVIFSKNPFLSDQNYNNYTYTKPIHSSKHPLKFTQTQQQLTILFPDNLKHKNQIIQIKGDTKIVSHHYIETKLQINITENSGQLRISNQEGKYLEKIYIKTFVKKNDGQNQFYKDGYTDLRGRYDYATLDTQSLEKVSKFAVLIVSNDLGSMIKEINPPSQVGTYGREVKLQSKLWTGKAQKEQEKQEIIYKSKSQCKK
ncbi:unnamed protein product (macronuclear) [Paramecium tetraurelia]|uniref:Uncharacterized protein n=1 Tax=Paramecium tetraurelia TaxID=5888 RepID=A0E2U5_PARTE|nr:uncharacterized protein GSPATT00022784001 [Paramecium tetraurelia]CAK89612.1 unnamed protein product [Paramecium tetraurelia]|eukprot:XP_001457009.1 hypothetical protein (macronuclear) [Paramecium tetraurelia strain d4-2]